MDITGRVMRWFITGIGVGNMFFPWLIGQFFETTGPSVMPLINLIAFILALGLLINMLVLTRMKKINRITGSIMIKDWSHCS